MLMTALRMGFINGRRVQPGATFEAPEGFKAAWAAPVGSASAAKATKPKAAKESPKALSELNKETTGQSFVEAHSGDIA